MLLSPGHSPRHISLSPSSPSQTLTLTSPSPSSSPPNPKKRRPPSILDEESYISSIESIIERDFFPDLPNLRDHLDLLLASRSHDPVLLRDAQLKILDRRAAAAAGIPPSDHLRSPVSSTPFQSHQTPSHPLPPIDPYPSPAALSLDDFCAKFTSEDNHSFSKILEKVNRKKREQFAHLLHEESPSSWGVSDRDRITDGYGTSGQPIATLDGWNYTAKNLLMYNPVDRGEVPLTAEEMAERLKGLRKEIDRSNTRFRVADSKLVKNEEAAGSSFLYTPVPGVTPAGASWPFADRNSEKSKKYDLEDLRKTPDQFYVELAGKELVKGYSYVKTPSPVPGESPFMTWGAIDGTPLRLDLEDAQVINGGSSDGPHFSIPLPASRDAKAHSLSREATRRLRERSKLYQKPPLPSPVRGGSASPSVRNLSPAAQKFVRNAIAKSSHGVDETLRASYRGASPGAATPKERSLSRFSRDGSLLSRSPSVRHDSATPW